MSADKQLFYLLTHRKARNSVKAAHINRFYGIQAEINAEQRKTSRNTLTIRAYFVVQYTLYIDFTRRYNLADGITSEQCAFFTQDVGQRRLP